MYKILGVSNSEGNTAVLGESYDYDEAEEIRAEFENVLGYNWDIYVEER